MSDDYIRLKLNSVIDITSIISLHYFKYSKYFKFDGETHDFYELVFVDSGEVTISDDGNSHTLKQGQGFIHLPNHFHNVKANNIFANFVIITFEGVFNFGDEICNRILSFDLAEKTLINNIINEGASSFIEPLNIIYQKQLTEIENAPFGYMQLIKNDLEKLIIILCRKANLPLSVNNKKNYVNQKSIVSDIINILNNNISKKITLDFLSKQLNYSTTYIKTIFKNTTSTSIIKYFNKMKIDEAKKLISEDKYTFSEIAEKLGFESIQYFSRQFSKHTNMSPSQYLKSVKLMNVL